MTSQALVDWWKSMGVVAWLLLGLLLVTGILALIVLLRWIFRGGLSRQMAMGLTGRRAEKDGTKDS